MAPASTPNSWLAPAFQEVILPSRSMLTMASTDEATIDASSAFDRSAALRCASAFFPAVTSRLSDSMRSSEPVGPLKRRPRD